MIDHKPSLTIRVIEKEKKLLKYKKNDFELNNFLFLACQKNSIP